MADEATIISSISLNKGNLQYQSQPQSFTADVSGTKGPTPGAIAVSTTGTNVDLSQLTTPGLVRVLNLDEDHAVHYGPYDPETLRFYPVFKALPGESYVHRFSDLLGDELLTGTGTGGASTVRLRMLAEVESCDVVVEAFEA
jgi:hypothetical protein